MPMGYFDRQSYQNYNSRNHIGFGGEHTERNSNNSYPTESKQNIEHRPSMTKNLLKAVGNFLKSTVREIHRLLEAAALAEETISGRNYNEATFDWTFSDNKGKSENLANDSLGIVHTKEIKQKVWKDTFEYIGQIPMERLNITKEIEMGRVITDPDKVTPCVHNYSLN